MILRALGYTSEFLPGEWPAEWVVKAKSLGILDGIKAATATGANRGDIAKMLYNSLDLYIGYINKDGDWRAFGENTEDFDTMLVRLGATFVKAEDADYDGVIRGSEKSVINLRPYVGAYADRYVNDDNEIIKVVPISEFLEGKFTSTTVFETTDGVEYKLSIEEDATAPFFRNGTYKGMAEADEIADNLDVPGVLAVDIDGKYIDTIYSVLYWEVTNAFMVDEDILEELEDDDTLDSDEFVLTTKDEIDLNSFELIGIEDLADLEEDNVVYVYVDDFGDIRRVAVGTEVVEGEVTKIRSDAYTVDGKAYEFADNTFVDAERPDVGEEVILYLDAYGDVFFYELVDSAKADKYAVVLRVENGKDVGSLRGYAAQVELFLADGTVKVFDVDSDYEKEGVITTGTGTEDPAWNDAVVPGYVIKYGLNKDGEINEIELVKSLSEATKNDTKLTAKGTYDGYIVASDVVIFTYDSKDASKVTKKANYGTADRAKLLDSTLDGVAYELDDNKIVFIYMSATSTASTEVYGVLSATEKNSSDAGWGVDLLVDGKAVFYDAEKNFASYSKLFLYVVDMTTSGTVNELSKITAADYDNIAVLTAAASVSGRVVTTTGAANTLRSGTTYADIADVASVTLDADVVVYKANDEATKLVAGSISDIKGKTNVLFYDIDDDKIFDIVLIGGETVEAGV
jgi:hypothetical protein